MDNSEKIILPLKPKISVITVCYNAENSIEKTIESVLNQNYSNIEYIIIDGKSTDNTKNILRKYRDKITKIISEPDSGLYDAMNKGLLLATGDYVNFMNAGDIFCDNNVIKDVIEKYNSSADVIYGNAVVINPNGSENIEIGEDDLNLLSKRPIYRHNASFTRLYIHKKYLFEISKTKQFSHALDYNHIFSIWKNGAKFQHVDVTVVKYKRIGISDRLVKNLILNFRISHQNSQPNATEYIKLFFDILRACRRILLR